MDVSVLCAEEQGKKPARSRHGTDSHLQVTDLQLDLRKAASRDLCYLHLHLA